MQHKPEILQKLNNTPWIAILIGMVFMAFAGYAEKSAALPFKGLLKSCETFLLGKSRFQIEPPAPEPHLREEPIRNLEELNLAFTRGLLPDLDDPEQNSAFRFYLATKFGRHETYRADPYIETLRRALREYPQVVKKPRFRNMKVTIFSQHAEPLAAETKSALDHIVRSAKIHSAKLIMAEANVGTYRKILNAPAKAPLKDLLPARLRVLLDNPDAESKGKALALLDYFIGMRAKLVSENQDVRAISQAIVDLVHEVSVLDPAIHAKLTSSNAAVALSGVKELIQSRDRLAFELGFPNHYRGLLKAYGVSSPRGLARPSQLDELTVVVSAEGDPKFHSTLESEYLVRNLSVVEQPLRSCLGGSDCSSDAYFHFAFEPFAQYFTLTDSEGASSGHMTVILGNLPIRGEKTKAAFVDKIQNLPEQALVPMLEAIRQSLEEFGYELFLSEDVADHSGISNDFRTRRAYAELLQKIGGEAFSGFKVPEGGYGFHGLYSRSRQQSIKMVRFHPPRDSFLDIKPARLDLPWRTKKIPLTELVQKVVSFKNGDLEQRLKYVSFLPILRHLYLVDTAQSQRQLAEWLEDLSLPLRFRSDLTVMILKNGLLTRRDVIDHIFRYYKLERAKIADRLNQLRGWLHGMDSFLLVLMYDDPPFVYRMSMGWSFQKLNLALGDMETFLPRASDRELVTEAVVLAANKVLSKVSPESRELLESVLRGPVGHLRLEERLRQYLVDEWITLPQLAHLMADLIKADQRTEYYLEFFDPVLTPERKGALRKAILKDPEVQKIRKEENGYRSLEREDRREPHHPRSED